MKFLRLWLPPIVWMVVIFLFSSRQSVSVAQDYVLNFIFFKSLHVIEYAILFILLRRAFLASAAKQNVVVSYAIAYVLTIIYAVGDEVHQTFVPTREGKLRDVIIDGIGASLAWILIVQLSSRAPKKLKNWGKRWQLW